MLVLEHMSRRPPHMVRMLSNTLPPGDDCAKDQGIMFGAQPDTNRAILAPCTREQYLGNRYRCFEHPGANGVLHADAIVLAKPGYSVAFASNDCGTLVITAPHTGSVAVIHPGRNQLMDIAHPTDRRTIVQSAVTALVADGARAEDLQATMYYQIRAEHFAHAPSHPYAQTIRAQAQLWGMDIINGPDLGLDLYRLCSLQLEYYGMQLKNIKRIGSSPFTSPDLASKRAGKPGSNLVVVSRLR